MPTVLLCHCDGTTGSTAFVDTSPSAHTLTAISGATIETSQVKFGTGAAAYSSGSSYLGIGGSPSDFDFQSGPFTIEAWAYATTTANVNAIVGQYSVGWFFGSIFNNLVFWYRDGSGTLVQWGATSTPIPTGAWHFYTADRDAGGTLRIYIDGVVVASTSAPTFQTLPTASTYIGNDASGGNGWSIGYIDEVRITKGTARYAGAFTPPTAPFPDFAPVTGTLAITQDSQSLVATGTVFFPITATLGITQANQTLTATGTVPLAGVTGTLVIAEASNTLAATGHVGAVTPYSLNLMLCPTTTQLALIGNDYQGFPRPFRYFLLSMWGCLGPEAREISFSNTNVFGGVDAANIQMRLRLIPQLSASASIDAFYGYPVSNVLRHFLVSVDGVAQIAQVYVNDAPVALSSGGWVGPPSLFDISGQSFNVWELNSSGSASPGPGQGDVFAAAPASFFDLSVTANRRKFINPNLTPVDLGSDASSVLGVPPQIWLTARSGVPTDFPINRGSGGGAWTDLITVPFTFQPSGMCVAPTLPAPKTLIDSELVFEPHGAFMDFAVEANRRLFVSSEGTPAWMGQRGELPFSIPPAVYLTTLGPPVDFTHNNGLGGRFPNNGLISPHDGPGCSTYTIDEAGGTAPGRGWRLTVSDDGGRTWSRLVKPRSVGAQGEYLTRLRWQKMGQSRQRLVRLECSDTQRNNIIGIYIDADQGMS